MGFHHAFVASKHVVLLHRENHRTLGVDQVFPTADTVDFEGEIQGNIFFKLIFLFTLWLCQNSY